MSDGFVFAGLGQTNDQPSIEGELSLPINKINESINKQANVEKELLNKPSILIDITPAKKGFETIVSGLTEAYIKKQNPDTSMEDLVRKFKKQKGCIGTLKKNKIDGVEQDDIAMIFRGKHREDLEKFLKLHIKLDADQIKIKGLEN
jgi:translation initiation factor 1 (eIF-1/SUI1)